MYMIEKLDLQLLLQSILETAVDGIINIDTQGIVININNAALRLFGYEKDELVGKKINILMDHHDAKHHDTYLDNYLNTRQAKIIGIGRQVFGKTKSGKIFPFRLAVSEVILNDKIIFTGIIHDLTELHYTLEELAKLNKELDKKVMDRTYEIEKVVNQLLSTNDRLKDEIDKKNAVELKLRDKEKQLNIALTAEKELNEIKSRFISTASHEFRTPLTTILSSISIIQKYQSQEEQHQRDIHIGKIKTSVNHLTALLNDFLSLTKLEEGKVSAQGEVIELSPLIDTIKEDLFGLTKGSKIIHANFENNNMSLFTDKTILRNILFNLISNAIKYSNDDIYLDVKMAENHTIIAIKDTGIGIPTDEQKHIFTRFFRASNVGNSQGTGLGLNIVLKYCDLIHASISFDSLPEEGTTFYLKIPNSPT